MEATNGYSAPAVAAAFVPGEAKSVLGGRTVVKPWRLDLADPGTFEAVVQLVARSYVAPKSAWLRPDRLVSTYLPKPGSVRKGDFGEILAGVLYSTRKGQPVPFKKLEGKPDGDATVQGPDVLALSLDFGADPRPTLVEVKFRSPPEPKRDLAELAASASSTSEERLVKAWTSGLQLMESHPDHTKSFALSAAEHLAALDPDASAPVHDRHGVLIYDRRVMTPALVEDRWGDAPPVSELHLLEVPDLVASMDRVYDAAGKLTLSATVSGTPQAVGAGAHVPGVAAPVSSDDAKAAVEAARAAGTLGIIEASLWLLADWDGMGVARARQVLESTDEPEVEGLAQLLTGALGAARRNLGGSEVLDRFANVVSEAWARRATGDEVIGAAVALSEDLPAALGDAMRYVAAATAHRLHRHALALVEAAGATGPRTTHLVDKWAGFGRLALWPSQAAALTGGLLDRTEPSLVIKMPTSAGKTALLQLLVADTLDREPDGVAVVLAKTKALVSQLSFDLKSEMSDGVEVRSSFGGLDFDTLTPATSIIGQHGAAILTPERFDLEWRRAVVDDDGPDLDAVKLLVVDEAHLIFESGRGARLEMILARAKRRGIRIVLLSSQFPDPATLAGWLEAKTIQSDWSPTWLQRFVYFNEDERGMLQAEVGAAEPVLTLTRHRTRAPGTAQRRTRTDWAAALVESHCSAGLTVVFSRQKNWVANLVDEISQRLVGDSWQPKPLLLRDANELEATEPAHAALLRAGIGVHHADIRRPVKQLIEAHARRGNLRCIVCTPTLLEGVDFPADTVLAVYPPMNRQGRIQVGTLRNLAGRAGRADRTTHGTLIVIASDATKAAEWLQAFRADLPPTVTALTSALRAVVSFLVNNLHAVTDGDDDKGAAATLDALLLTAGVEGSVIDGDWRAALEDVLGRTMWFIAASPTTRAWVLERVVQRAEVVKGFIGSGWDRTIYRSGLPLAAALNLRAALEPHVDSLVAAVRNPEADLTDWLTRLVIEVAPRSELQKLPALADHDPVALDDALRRWMAGEAETTISADHPDLWDALAPTFDTFLPWVITAAIDFTIHAAGAPDLRDSAHRRLGVARLRYGVRFPELCEPVRLGLDRTLVGAATDEWLELGRYEAGDLVDHVINRVQELQAQAEAEAAAEAAAADAKAVAEPLAADT